MQYEDITTKLLLRVFKYLMNWGIIIGHFQTLETTPRPGLRPEEEAAQLKFIRTADDADKRMMTLI